MNKFLLSGLVNSHPLVKVAVKYWWLAIPAGWAMWTLSKKRDKVDAAGLIQDFSITFGPILPIILLGEILADRADRQQATAVPQAAFSDSAGQAIPVSTPVFDPGASS